MISVWSDDLQCSWTSWECVVPSVLKLILPEHNVCDMEGAIRIASAIMPDVQIIGVFEGGNLVVKYKKIKSGKWEAHVKNRLQSI